MIYSIYKIVDNTNGNIYVGSTKELNKRKWRHKNKSDCSCKKIIENNDYYFEVIEECDEDIRFEREQYWIDNLNNVINKNKARRNKEEHKILKRDYDKIRCKWKDSFGEICKDPYSIIRIDVNLFT